MMIDRASLRSVAPSYLFVLTGIAALVIYYGVLYREEFASHGKETFNAIRSRKFSNCLLICFGGSAGLLFNSVADCWGKYVLRDAVDPKYYQEFVLILCILLPSICTLTNIEDMNAISFFWVIFHVQILAILNVSFLFWAERMSISVRSPEVLINSGLSVGTFVMHVCARKPSWSARSDDGPNIVYMVTFIAQLLYLLVCVRQTRNKVSNKNAVVLIDTAAAEQQWALCIICAVFSYYVAFLVLEAVVFPGNDRFHLTADYVGAQYGLLAVFALGMLTLHQRKEMYHGVMSQVRRVLCCC
jgi:hypothetical protein